MMSKNLKKTECQIFPNRVVMDKNKSSKAKAEEARARSFDLHPHHIHDKKQHFQTC